MLKGVTLEQASSSTSAYMSGFLFCPSRPCCSLLHSLPFSEPAELLLWDPHSYFFLEVFAIHHPSIFCTFTVTSPILSSSFSPKLGLIPFLIPWQAVPTSVKINSLS